MYIIGNFTSLKFIKLVDFIDSVNKKEHCKKQEGNNPSTLHIPFNALHKVNKIDEQPATNVISRLNKLELNLQEKRKKKKFGNNQNSDKRSYHNQNNDYKNKNTRQLQTELVYKKLKLCELY